MKKILVIITMCLIITGCESKKNILDIDCNSKKSSITIKKGTKFECKLLNVNYKFKIESIKDKKIILTVSNIGLSKETDKGTISLREKVTEFEIEKGKETKLVTQSMDYNEKLILKWK